METNKKLPKSTSGFAITSLILGIISFIPTIGFLFGITAIIFGIIAIRKVKDNNMSRKGMAIAGIILGSINILLTIMLYSSYLLLSTIK